MSARFSVPDDLPAGKDYDILNNKHDPMYDDVLRATEIVKAFIKKTGAIIYGGTAIDYALRRVGSKLYPDDDIPDLDFYSTNSVTDAYDLADILYKDGFESTRAIVALYSKAMKVDIGDNHFIADISYVPADMINIIPTIEYDGMRVVHPHWQYIDMHSSLSLPYDAAPQESIFNRWKKDVSRFNILFEHYPIMMPKGANATTKSTLLPLTTVKIASICKKFVFNGFAAYAMFYAEAKSLGIADGTIPAEMVVTDDGITVQCLGTVDTIHHDETAAIALMGDVSMQKYEPTIGLFPRKLEWVVSGGGKSDASPDYTILCGIITKLLVISSGFESHPKMRCVCVQYLLKFFLSKYLVAKAASKPQLADTYIAFYVSLMTMISRAEGLESKESGEGGVSTNKFMLSVQTYGSENTDLSRETMLSYMYFNMGVKPFPNLPKNYDPAAAEKQKKGHPPFDANSIPFFHESGKKIEG